MYLSEYTVMLDRSTSNVLYLFMFCIKGDKIATIFSGFVVLLIYLGTPFPLRLWWRNII